MRACRLAYSSYINGTIEMRLEDPIPFMLYYTAAVNRYT